MSQSATPRRPRGLERQRAVLAQRGVRPLVAASMVGRLPLGMTALGLILLLRGAGRSYALAGVVDGAFALGVGLAQPVLGRMVDRLGLQRVLAPVSIVFGALLAALTLSGTGGAGAYVLVPLALLTGMALPPVGAAMRALWPQLVTAPDLRASAYTLEAILQEFSFIVGPPLVAGLAAIASPRVALLIVAALGALGTATFSLLAVRATATPTVHRARALDSSGTRIVLTLSLLLGASFGSEEVAMPAFAELHGARAAAGVLLSALALGSLLGGVVFGTRTTEQSAVRRMQRGLLLCGIALAGVFAARSLAAMAALMVLAGLPIAPTFAAQYLLLDALGVRGAATETFAWNSTAIFAGAALGNALAGALIAASSYRAGVALAVALALIAGALAFALAGRLSAALRLSPGSP